MDTSIHTRVKDHGDTAAKWTSINPVLADREWGLETDTRKLKFGDGASDWNSLAYAAGSALDAALEAIAGLSSNGLIARTGSGTAAARTLAGTANEITVTNGSGESGN